MRSPASARTRLRGGRHRRLQPAAARRARAAVPGPVQQAPHQNVGREDRRVRRLRLRDARVQPQHIRSTEERDRLFVAEWNNKAAGFVGYGSAGGVRAVEHLRLVMAEVQVATVRSQVSSPSSPTSRTSPPSRRPPATSSRSRDARPAPRLGHGAADGEARRDASRVIAVRAPQRRRRALQSWRDALSASLRRAARRCRPRARAAARPARAHAPSPGARVSRARTAWAR